MPEPRAVLDEIATLLDGTGGATGRFLDALAAGAGGDVLVLSPDEGAAHAEAFAAWCRSLGTCTDVAVDTVERVGADRGRLLVPDRVVVVLPCGRLLSPDDVACAAAVLERPPGAGMLVLAGAEDVDPADLDVTRRGVWRMLVGVPDVAWNGQDLAAHRCPTWDPDGAGDDAALRSWVGGAAPDPELVRLRAVHALDTLEHELPRETGPARRAAATRRHELRETASAMRRRILELVDADARVLAMRVDTSGQTVEQDLRAGIESQVATAGSDAVSDLVSDGVVTAVRLWAAQTEVLVTSTWRRAHEKAVALVDGPDARRVAEALPPGSPTPRAAVDAIIAVPALRLTVASAPTAPDGPRSSSWSPTLRKVGYGSVATAASLALIGVGPAAVAVAALGTVGGMVAEDRAAEARRRKAVRSGLERAIDAVVAEHAAAFRAEVATHTSAVRRGVEEAFAAVTAGVAARPDDDRHADARRRRLDELRRGLVPTDPPTTTTPAPGGS
jgi:hypothetical protein